MFEKIDKFIDRFLNWKIFKNILLAELFIIIHSFITSFYNISFIHLVIMNFSFGIAISFFTKAINEFMKGKEEG